VTNLNLQKLSASEVIVILTVCFYVVPECDRLTHKPTDGQTDRSTVTILAPAELGMLLHDNHCEVVLTCKLSHSLNDLKQ